MNDNSIEVIQQQEYLRERWEPRPGDVAYLHLSDLRNALERFRTDEKIRILDFGCGGSPYRALFPYAEYIRADFTGGEGLDYIIDERSVIPEPDASFDLILSTQVVEHCTDPVGYLNECQRLLRVGGRLLCSTHGTFEDHGCPYDYQRWTAEGLKRDLTRAGFNVLSNSRLTAGPRALIFLMERLRATVVPRDSLALKILATTMKKMLGKNHPGLHRAIDRAWPQERIKDSGGNGDMYIALLADAVKI